MRTAIAGVALALLCWTADAHANGEQYLVDSYGQPVALVRGKLLDSKGVEIPFTDVPLSKAFVCYPSPGSSSLASEEPVTEMPSDYICTPAHSEATQVIRVLATTCPVGYKPCYVHNYPDYVACCHM